MEVDKGLDQKSDIEPGWTAVHALFKNAFMEDEKYHNLMRWLIYTQLALSWLIANQNDPQQLIRRQ